MCVFRWVLWTKWWNLHDHQMKWTSQSIVSEHVTTESSWLSNKAWQPDTGIRLNGAAEFGLIPEGRPNIRLYYIKHVFSPFMVSICTAVMFPLLSPSSSSPVGFQISFFQYNIKSTRYIYVQLYLLRLRFWNDLTTEEDCGSLNPAAAPA